jgi:sterol desaturase/sphingolipid hydroxylase (fatty acid hydroxylase superfamily)
MRNTLSYILWPLSVLGWTFAFYLGFRSGHPLPLVFLVANIAMIAFVAVAEQMIPYRRDWNAITDRQSVNDLAHALIENQIGERLGAFVFLALAANLAESLRARLGQPLWPTEWPFVAQVLLVTLAADGLDYWKHRLLHTVPWLWRVHALHHGIARLHVFKAARLHFADILVRFLIVYTPLVILGVSAELLFWYTAFISIFGAIGHSNIELRIPSALHWIFMTPQVHRLHHSIERAVSDTNYVNIFPVWDVFFGTFSNPNAHTVERVGVVGDPIPSGFLGQFFAPFIWSRLEERV